MLLTGCSTVTTSNGTNVESSSSGSYKALLFVNGQELQTILETADEQGLVPGGLIGTVKAKVGIDVLPIMELTSNYLEEGIEIYTVKDNPKIVLAKNEID